MGVSLAAPVLLAAVHPLLRWRRHYTGQLVTLTRADQRAALRLTPGHPVLTHVGWRRADAVVPGVRVVAAAPDRIGYDADLAFDHARDTTGGAFQLPVDLADFRGDGDRFSVTVTCLDERCWPPARPYTGNEGARPRASPGAVTAVLDALCTPAEFAVATWSQACARVPGLAQAYPGGPVQRHDGISAELRHRLGAALAALPPAPLDRGDLGERLLGARVPLGLVEIAAVALAPTVAVVHDVTDAHGAVTAGGVVVGA